MFKLFFILLNIGMQNNDTLHLEIKETNEELVYSFVLEVDSNLYITYGLPTTLHICVEKYNEKSNSYEDISLLWSNNEAFSLDIPTSIKENDTTKKDSKEFGSFEYNVDTGILETIKDKVSDPLERHTMQGILSKYGERNLFIDSKKYHEEITFYSLRKLGGKFRIFYKYDSNDLFSEKLFLKYNIELPGKLNNYYKYNGKIISNTLCIEVIDGKVKVLDDCFN